MSTSALAEIDAMIAQMRGMRDLTKEIAAEAAPLVQAAARQTAAAGTTATGERWKETVEHKPALPNAANAITAVAAGSAVIIKLAYPYGFANGAKGTLRRRILPETGQDSLPPGISAAMKQAAENVFARVQKGGRT